MKKVILFIVIAVVAVAVYGPRDLSIVISIGMIGAVLWKVHTDHARSRG